MMNFNDFQRVDIEIPPNSVVACRDCRNPMKKQDTVGLVLDCNPPISGWDWLCSACGNIENGGWECEGKYFIMVYVTK